MKRTLYPFIWALLLLAGAAATTQAQPGEEATDDAFLDALQARTFGYFWDFTNAENGLTPDRAPRPSFSSVAAVGFALTAYGVGVERGYVSREAAVERVLTTLRFLWEAPQHPEQGEVAGYRGFYYHFLDMETGHRYRDVELSSIDTALLMGGVLFCQQYFDGQDEDETAIRALADSLYRRVEWDWFQAQQPLVTMAWHPEVGFGQAKYEGYNEAMLLYVLALGSPNYPVGGEVWQDYTSTYRWGDFYGQEHVQFSPLFGHQYSHVWIDFRNIQDAYMRERGIDYFENSRRATLSQRAYAQANPMGWKDYGDDIWGLTACDGPASVQREVNGEMRQFHTYWARGASLEHVNDDGTIAPTAAGGSVPFAPEVCIPALKAMRERYGEAVFSQYGFLDAFNPTFTFEDVELGHGRIVPGVGWVDSDYLGIDQGPILLMIENYRSGLVWEKMKQSPYIVQGLKRAGFSGGWLEGRPAPWPVGLRTGSAMQAPRSEAAADIVVIGSSTAAGTGPEDVGNAWVNRFRRYVHEADASLRVLNLARGGYTTYHLMPTGTVAPGERPAPDTLRNITQALARDPAAIIVNLPSNDAAQGFSVADQLRNFDAIASAAREQGVPVWITTTQPRNLPDAQRQDQAALRDSILARYGDHAIDAWTGIALDDGTIDPAYDAGDHVHLNDAAHALLFERVKEAGVLEAVRETTEP